MDSLADSLFLGALVPTMLAFALGLTLILRHIVNTQGEGYRHTEYRIDPKDLKRKPGPGKGPGGQGPISLN